MSSTHGSLQDACHNKSSRGVSAARTLEMPPPTDGATAAADFLVGAFFGAFLTPPLSSEPAFFGFVAFFAPVFLAGIGSHELRARKRVGHAK